MFFPDTAGSRATKGDGNHLIGKKRNRKNLYLNTIGSYLILIRQEKNNVNYSSTEYAVVI